jgi:hypothetical protein
MCAAEQERTRYKNEWERRTYFYGRVEEHIPHRPLKRVEENALSGVCVIRFFNHPDSVFQILAGSCPPVLGPLLTPKMSIFYANYLRRPT